METKKKKVFKGREFRKTVQINLVYATRKLYGDVCMACGSTEDIQVDHIFPWCRYPKLRYKISNLQVLCGDCNNKKGGKLVLDYRTEQHKEKLRASQEEWKVKRKIQGNPNYAKRNYPENYKEMAKYLIGKLTEQELKVLRKGMTSLEQFYKKVYWKYQIMVPRKMYITEQNNEAEEVVKEVLNEQSISN